MVRTQSNVWCPQKLPIPYLGLKEASAHELTGKNGKPIQTSNTNTFDYSKLSPEIQEAILFAAGVDGALNPDDNS